MICIKDYETFSLEATNYPTREFYRNGALHEETLRENIEAFRRLVIRPRFLTRDVSVRQLATTFLGERVQFPIGVAPTAMQKLAHPDGELATARACASSGSVFILSTMATSTIEEVAAAAPDALKWFQLYIYKNRAVSASLLRRAEASGYKAIVITVDTPFVGIRLGEMRSQFHLPPHLKAANFEGEQGGETKIERPTGNLSALTEHSNAMFDPALTWKDVAWVMSVTKLPVLVKGILTQEDAILAIEAGVAGIIVSNHGGRQLDSAPATIEALAEVTRVARNRCEVYLDGGVRTGTDVLKALALGARGVFLGRPILWGLSHEGEQGVKKVLEILRRELDVAMALSGCAALSDIKRDLVVHRHFYAKL